MEAGCGASYDHAMTTLALNPALDLAAAISDYARDGVARIENVLAPESADAVAGLLEQNTPWRLTLSGERESEAECYDQARVAAIGQAALADALNKVALRAQEGFGYLYLSYPMINAYLAGWDTGHPIHGVTELINSPPFLDIFRRVTGHPEVIKADAKATLYRPGDFLALHDDGISPGRVAAYTLGFTRAWRPDWGGQLLMHGNDLEIERGLSPGFNALTIFKVPRWHSVAPVAPYAGAPRLSIVGWARRDPKI